MGWLSGPDLSNQSLSSDGAAVKADMAKNNSAYGAAVDNTSQKQAASDNFAAKSKGVKDNQAKAAKESAAADKAVDDNQAAQKAQDRAVDRADDNIDNKQDVFDDKKDAYEEKQKAYAEMGEDDSYEATQERAAMKADLDASRKEMTDSAAEITKAKEEKKAEEAKLKALEDEEAGLEEEADRKEKNKDTWDEAGDSVDEKQKELDDEVEDAIENEEEVREEQAEKYPGTFGAQNDALENVKDQEKADAQKEIDDANAAVAAENEAALEEERKAAAERAEAARLARLNRIAELEAKLASGEVQGEEANKVIQELEDMKNIQKQLERDKNETLNNILAAQLASKISGKDHNKAYLYFDAPDTMGLGGKLEDMITANLQPIYKHAFIGEFPEKLANLDWMVKTMDRPKVDIEYVEQIRNNVKRQYPVKYNFGDLSMTFHDDVHHKTITIIHDYFTGQVWDHKSIMAGGTFLLRDSVVIPEIIVWDLTVETDTHLKYIYKNVSLVSFDYDAPDEAEDGGIHTIQAVFKIEGYEVVVTGGPRWLNLANDPIWG